MRQYIVGQIVYPNAWNNDINEACTNGIHVFEKSNYLPNFIENKSNMNDILDEFKKNIKENELIEKENKLLGKKLI